MPANAESLSTRSGFFALCTTQRGTTVGLTPKQYRSLLSTYLAPQWRSMIVLAVFLFGGIALQVLNPQILRFFIDAAQRGSSDTVLLGAAIIFMAAALGQQALGVAETALSQRIGWTATNALRGDLMQHVFKVRMSFHTIHAPGELIERIDGDVTLLANFFSAFVIRILGSTLLLIGVLIVQFRISWIIGISMLVFTLATLGVLLRLRGISREEWVAGRQSSAELAGFIEEQLAGREDIRSNDAIPYSMERLRGIMRTLMVNYRWANMKGHITAVVAQLSLTLGASLGLGIGAYLYVHGSISLGAVYVTSYYGYLLAQPLGLLSDQIGDFQQASASLGRIASFLAEPEEDVSAATLPMSDVPPEIDFYQVSFGYHPAEPVLSGLTFRIKAGTRLGILGRTGSGKTTISRLLFRLYEPQRGLITLSGVPLPEIRLPDLRRRIGLVTQEVDVFDASVRENLTLFDESVPDDTLLRAIENLGLLDWYEQLPAGLDTRLHGSAALSGGEAQILALIRVFLKDPTVVILDEASSRLDPATERFLDAALDRLLAARTTIVIAHHLPTIRRCRDIVILSNGRIVEQGDRATLEADPKSHFSALLRGAKEGIVV